MTTRPEKDTLQEKRERRHRKRFTRIGIFGTVRLIAVVATNDVQVEVVFRRARLPAKVTAPRIPVGVKTAVEQIEYRVVEDDPTVFAGVRDASVFLRTGTLRC